MSEKSKRSLEWHGILDDFFLVYRHELTEIDFQGFSKCIWWVMTVTRYALGSAL
jgi:hypothetical protein